MEAAESTHYASHAWNPFFLQGTKTFAYEICEELGWRSPDTVVLPVGNGTLLLGTFMGFRELVAAGLVKTMPELIAVQSSRCDPLARAFEAGAHEAEPIKAGPTIADGIAVLDKEFNVTRLNRTYADFSHKTIPTVLGKKCYQSLRNLEKPCEECPVTNMKCSIPASRASSTTCWIRGRSTTVSISFGIAFVAGRNLVPSPATGKTALRIGRGMIESPPTMRNSI